MKQKPIREHRCIDWDLVEENLGDTLFKDGFNATPGLVRLLGTYGLKWNESVIMEFYSTLWIPDNRSFIAFSLNKNVHRISCHNIARALGMRYTGEKIHNRVFPANRWKQGVMPDMNIIGHLYDDPNEPGFTPIYSRFLSREAKILDNLLRHNLFPRSGYKEKVIPILAWLLHLILSKKPINVVDFLIGEMEEFIGSDVEKRTLPFAPYIGEILKHGDDNGAIFTPPIYATLFRESLKASI